MYSPRSEAVARQQVEMLLTNTTDKALAGLTPETIVRCYGCDLKFAQYRLQIERQRREAGT